MTEQMIYQLAWSHQVTIWGKEKEVLEKMPENAISQIREQKAWDRLKEIEALMEEKGYR